MSKFYQFERQSKQQQESKFKSKEPQQNYDQSSVNKKQKQQHDAFKPKENKKQQSPHNEKMRKSVLIADEEGQQLGWCHNCCACTKLQYYKEYFKVTNEDVINRIKKNIFFWIGGFFQPQNQQYDFYGPFWIYTTVIFCLSSVPNIIKYQVQDPFEYNFTIVGVAFGFMYLQGFLFPILLTFVLKFLGGDHTHIQIVCLYGYSMSTYVICLLLCSINVCILHYILLIYGVGVKIAFIVKNLFEQQSIPTNKKLLVTILVIIEAVAQFLIIIFVFVVCATPPSATQQQHNLAFLSMRKFQE